MKTILHKMSNDVFAALIPKDVKCTPLSQKTKWGFVEVKKISCENDERLVVVVTCNPGYNRGIVQGSTRAIVQEALNKAYAEA